MTVFDLAKMGELASDTPVQTKTLSGRTWVLILTALSFSERMYNWTGSAENGGLTESEKDDVQRWIADAISEINHGW